MEKLPLSPRHNRKLFSYESTKNGDDSNRLQEIPEKREEMKSVVVLDPESDSTWLSKLKRKKWKRRQSSEGSLIHITGTGTLYEESLNCKDCYRGKV